MALSGSLREFDLTDIFQLLGQQKKSGRLTVQDKKEQCSVIFSRGEVIAAETATLSLISVLCHYLTFVRQYPESRIREFLEVGKGNTGVFLETLRKIQYLTPEEESILSRMTIEDLACELFLLGDGQYRFEPLDSVGNYGLYGVSFSTDAICMEAMRRADEWSRFQEGITPEMLFVPALPVEKPSPELFADDVSGYILSLLNGKRTVGELSGLGFVSRYRIYETIFQSWQGGQIAPVQQDSAAPLGKSPGRLPVKRLSNTLGQRLTTIMATLLIAAGVLAGSVFYYLIVQGERFRVAQLDWPPHAAAFSLRKFMTAQLAFETQTGLPPSSPDLVFEAGLLHKHDIKRAPIRSKKPRFQTNESINE